MNLLLDVTSTGVLVVEREGSDYTKPVQFTLIGTMNPSEGLLRPQLIDRFGLCANLVASEQRAQILKNVLLYDQERDHDAGKDAAPASSESKA